jgi:hypothetical protein
MSHVLDNKGLRSSNKKHEIYAGHVPWVLLRSRQFVQINFQLKIMITMHYFMDLSNHIIPGILNKWANNLDLISTIALNIPKNDFNHVWIENNNDKLMDDLVNRWVQQ